jgi:hypothetical protein
MNSPEAGKSFDHTTLQLLRAEQKNDDSTDMSYWESKMLARENPRLRRSPNSNRLC